MDIVKWRETDRPLRWKGWAASGQLRPRLRPCFDLRQVFSIAGYQLLGDEDVLEQLVVKLKVSDYDFSSQIVV